MDATTNRLVDYAMHPRLSRLPADVAHECKRRVIDSFACALGAYDESLSGMARAFAQRQAGGSGAAAVWGCPWRATLESAAFANGVMLRVLDMNDMYRVRSGGHPSDVIAAIWTVAEAVHADGQAVISAVVAAYDVYCSFCEAVDVNTLGWDQPVYGVIACVVGAGRVLGLTGDQMGNAIALALAPNMALVQSRRGELSNWKGCAGANASRNAVFAALLAQDGFTGPPAVFEGKGGLWDVIGRFDWDIRVDADVPHRIASTDLKSFPICYHAQSAAWAALELRRQIDARDIAALHIDTYYRAFHMLGNDPHRWAPKTRETADHSLPYVLAVSLLDGEVTSRSFADDRLNAPSVRDLMQKVTVAENAAMSAQYPEASPCRLTARTTSGRTLEIEVRYPKGHRHNRMDDRELDTKFRSMFGGFGDERQCEVLLKALWDLDRVPDVSALSPLLVHS